MMTRKDFDLVADVLRTTIKGVDDPAVAAGVRLAAYALSCNLKEANSAFQPERFMAAVNR